MGLSSSISDSGTLTLPGGASLTLSGGTTVTNGKVTAGPGGVQAALSGGSSCRYGPGTVLIPDTSVPLGFQAQWSNPFTDVAGTAWYYEGVSYVCLNGLFAGASSSAFRPEAAMTRGMLAVVLWRMAGQPAAGAAPDFADVPADAYCAEAIRWAASRKIVDGYGSGNFGPNDAVTREQMAAILYRYAKVMGYDVSVGEETNILSYDDAFSISEYAIPAMQWACGAGLVLGSGNRLMPGSGATRAQTAAILMRFCQNAAK